jgi:cytidylate kinase
VPKLSGKYRRIGVSGLMHSGKTTFSSALIEEDGYKVLRFAGPVKEMALHLAQQMLFAKAQLSGSGPFTLPDGEEMAKNKAKYRGLFQWVGEFARANWGEDFWVQLLYQQNTKLMVDLKALIVVDDLRHHNELRFLKQQGFYTVRIERPEKQRRKSVEEAFNASESRYPTKKEYKKMMSHESEIYVPELDVDEVITNDGDLDDLIDAATRLAWSDS